MTIFIYIGIAALVIAGFMVGAWTTGDRQRGNFHSEDPEERPIKRKIATWCVYVAIASFAIAGILYFL